MDESINYSIGARIIAEKDKEARRILIRGEIILISLVFILFCCYGLISQICCLTRLSIERYKYFDNSELRGYVTIHGMGSRCCAEALSGNDKNKNRKYIRLKEKFDGIFYGILSS